MKRNDIVVVIGDESIPERYLGTYGRIVGEFDQKVVVELHVSVNGRGSLSHTAFRSDLEKVGSITHDIF